MLVSILHRVTGVGVGIAGAAALVWWLLAASQGAAAYASFLEWATSKWALVVWIPLSWGLIQHTLSGLRHLVLDIGAGYELSTNKFWANTILVASVLLTGLIWLYIFYGRG